MSKKVVFIGPSGAGKTTLRKIFFEGENSTKLLEYALEPTFGEESLILRLPGINEDIGIFDLAGQENERWLNSSDNSIFYETKILIVVIDSTASSDNNIDFIRKVIDVRNKLTPKTRIFLLIHKIDLISQKKIRDVNSAISTILPKDNSIKYYFTSLKKKYFTQILSNFIEIMKSCFIDESSEEALLFNVIDESIKLINLISKEIVINKKDLHEKLNRPANLISHLIDNLILKGHLKQETVNKQDLISLTEKGKNYYKDIIESFSTVDLDSINSTADLSQFELEKEIPPIIGALIADKDGRNLLKIEIFENALEQFILKNDPSYAYNNKFDLDLIPMFISALEKFSLELNIQNLTGFGLKGTNLGMHIFSYDRLTVTVFLNPKVNIDPIAKKIENYFYNLFEEFETEFNLSLSTGQVDGLFPIMNLGRNWLEELNEYYNNLIINLEIYDLRSAQKLYSKIDELFERVKLKNVLTLERMKKLKVDLMKAILENDYQELKKIAQITQDLSVFYI